MEYNAESRSSTGRYAETGKPLERDPKRGEIYWIDRNPSKPTIGAVEWPQRPGIIVSSDALNVDNRTVMVVYLTASPAARADTPTRCTINSAKKPSVAICEQITTIDRTQIGYRIGTVTEIEMITIDHCIAKALSIQESRADATSSRELQEAHDKIEKLKKMYIDLLNSI